MRKLFHIWCLIERKNTHKEIKYVKMLKYRFECTSILTSVICNPFAPKMVSPSRSYVKWIEKAMVIKANPVSTSFITNSLLMLVFLFFFWMRVNVKQNLVHNLLICEGPPFCFAWQNRIFLFYFFIFFEVENIEKIELLKGGKIDGKQMWYNIMQTHQVNQSKS